MIDYSYFSEEEGKDVGNGNYITLHFSTTLFSTLLFSPFLTFFFSLSLLFSYPRSLDLSMVDFLISPFLPPFPTILVNVYPGSCNPLEYRYCSCR